MRYVMGVDSGGTKYLVRAQTLKGENIAQLQGPPAAHYSMTMEQAALRVRENIDACLAKFGGKREDCECLVVGTTGLDQPEDQETVEQLYRGLFNCPSICVNDAVVAHHAVTGGVGALVIAGTGSVAYGRNSAGQEARCGGWPPVIFGDEGSGTWISLHAISHLSRVLDGRLPADALSERVAQRLGVRRGEDLVAVCIDIENKRWTNPGLSAVVDQTASDECESAMAILYDAANHTVALADSIITRLTLYKEEPFIVGAWGSAIAKSPLHFARFSEALRDKYPNVQVRISEKDAAEGACEMARGYLRRHEKAL